MLLRLQKILIVTTVWILMIPLAFSQTPLPDNGKIYRDNVIPKMNYNEYFQTMITKWEAREIKIHQPLPKYNKLKPWQIKTTELYLKKKSGI